MALVRKSKKAVPPKQDAVLKQAVAFVKKHPAMEKKVPTLHSISFKAADDDRVCLEFRNQTVVTKDPVTGEKIVTVQPVCVKFDS